jgi:hypothetical protein
MGDFLSKELNSLISLKTEDFGIMDIFLKKDAKMDALSSHLDNFMPQVSGEEIYRRYVSKY